MVSNIFVNLPVKDLEKTKEFFIKLGFTFNEKFTDKTAAAMVIGENIYAMLLTEEKFKGFTRKELVDAHKSTEVLVALSVENKEKVNEMTEKALAAGGNEPRPVYDYGFMFGRCFEDLDGHIWEVFWMDPEAAKNGPPDMKQL